MLVQNDELFVEDNFLYQKTYSGGKTRIGALYRRISDEYLDPLTFEPCSLIGIPNLMEAYRAGNVAIINAPGNGVADDKGIYYFVPKMIKYYLNEEPILKNAPTYLPFYHEDKEYVLENIEKEYGRLCSALNRIHENTPYHCDKQQLAYLGTLIVKGDGCQSSVGSALDSLGKLFDKEKK